MRFVDLNADVGEGFPYDAELLDVVTSANIACGFHAGDAETMRWLCALCVRNGVAIGAQVSYRDRAGFGRREMSIRYDALRADLVEQRQTLSAEARAVGGDVRYVKPHGALYHRAGWDVEQARAVIDAAGDVPVLGSTGDALRASAARAGVRVVHEFFADRAYAPSGGLVPRTEPGAVVDSVSVVAARVVQLVRTGTVTTSNGTDVAVEADSICVHGDTAGALELAHAVRDALMSCGVTLCSFGSAVSR
jgi:UPF0271 protein